MKALEKAAKDRMDARAEPVAAETAAPAPAAKELALEPLGAEAPQAPAAPRAEPAPARPAAAAAPAREQTQAQASTVMQASATSRPARGGGVGAYVRAHPLPVFGTIAGLFALGFGIYVYLQIAHPGLFIERSPLAPAKGPVTPLAQAPVAPAGPLPAAPLLKEAAAESAAAAPVRRQKPAASPIAPEEPATRSRVVVSAGDAEPVLHPMLPQAYAALQSGQLDQAQRLYQGVLGAEPKNVDALLGLAAIAVRQGNSDEATRRYLQVLDLEPRNALAQSGLIALLGRADPVAAESRLKQLIAREPSAHLYFTLGNLYADQSQWAAAQHAYFQAHHLEPANPDYAYNLAVGLEHVSQPKLALGFYQRAMQLAAVRGRAHFNLAQAQERIGTLAAQVE
ncbi:MAG TPA: tetratricopeptide repeat protein [Burkholderiales bacterium]|nr:tetratricopeptide repeat protein [Burkholderiales bacterium]